MPSQVQSDITVNETENGIKFTKTQHQMFDKEPFLDVYNDTVTNLENIKDQIEGIEKQILNTQEEHSEELDQIHTMLSEEPQEEAELEPSTVSDEALSAYQDMKQQSQKMDQMKAQVRQIIEQLEAMEPLAEKVANTLEEKEAKEYEAPQYVKPETETLETEN